MTPELIGVVVGYVLVLIGILTGFAMGRRSTR
jgi:hypothetical protein